MAGTTASCFGSSECMFPVGKFGVGTTIMGNFHGNLWSTSSDWNANDCAKDGLTAFIAGKGMSKGVNLVSEIGGITFSPGTYTHASAISIGGANPIVTLDGGGDENAVFIFIAGSSLTTSSFSQVVLINGATAENVFWVVGTALVVGVESTMVGTFLAGSAVVIKENGKIWGRVIAQTTVVCHSCVGVEIPKITSPDCRLETSEPSSEPTFEPTSVPTSQPSPKPELKVSFVKENCFCLD